MAEDLLENSIVPIADALAKKIGLSLPGTDKVKEAGALLAFEAINTQPVWTLFLSKSIWIHPQGSQG